MLRDAILSIREAETRATEERERRSAARRARTIAEEYRSHLEELLLDGATTIAPGVLHDIRVFVTANDPALVPRLGRPAATLDALFELQERMEARRRRSRLDAPGRVA